MQTIEIVPSRRLLSARGVPDQPVELLLFGRGAVDLFVPWLFELKGIQLEHFPIAFKRLRVVLRVGKDHGQFESIGVDTSIPFLQLHFVGVGIAELVEPCPFVESDGIDDERIAFPTTRYRGEGDTLVADVVALTDQLWFDQAGNFHSNEIHIIERYRMTAADTIEYVARIEDSIVYSKPWTLRTILYRIKDTRARIIEDECLEDANGIRHHVSPTDPRNLLKSDYSRWKSAPQK